MPADERAVCIMVACLGALPAWLRGGTHAQWSWPLVWAGLLGVGLLFVLTLRRQRGGSAGGAQRHPFIRWSDPLLWLGAAALTLMFIQWWNAGRILYFDSVAREWAYSAPRHPGLPAAITRAEARQMLDWFVPAWVILLALRSQGVTPRGIRQVWRWTAYNAAVLALFGMIQFMSGTTHMFWILPMRPHFFATFGYPNHAGSFFMLIMCMSAAILSFDWGAEGHWRVRVRRTALGAVFVLALLGATFSLSRLAVILSWLLLVPVGAIFLRFLWPQLTPARRVNVIAAGAAVVSLAALLTFAVGREAIRKEFLPEQDNKTFMDREVSFRWFQLKSAWHMWQDYRWCGVGGWGYRYLLGHYVPPEMWKKITEGKANVHNDPLQFLCEFGLWGAGSMAAIVLALLAAAWRCRQGYPPMWTLPMMGIALVWMQSLIDLPFRSSAVLNLWLIALAGVARVAPRRREPAAVAPVQNS